MQIIKTNGKIEYPEDCRRIKVILLNKGYDASLAECEILWEMYSDSMAAGWMSLPSGDDEVFSCIQYYLEEDL